MSRYSVAPVTLTLTLEPCDPNPNPKGSYMGRRTSSLVLVGTLRENSRGRMRTRDTCVFGGVYGVPLGPDPNPRLGLGRGPPGQSRGYSLGNSKKGKKINACFCTDVQTQVYCTRHEP